MFSGIIEETAALISSHWEEGVLRLRVERPSSFQDLRLGDSIAVNGVCLTVEFFDNQVIQFALGHETLTLLQVKSSDPKHLFAGHRLNLERSLKWGDRNHGHMVSGHAEGLARLVRRDPQGESLVLAFQLPAPAFENILNKGSITLNGVSLTVNRVTASLVEVCLIPETLKRTNLGALELGDVVSYETDWMAKQIRAQIGGIKGPSLFLVNLEH